MCGSPKPPKSPPPPPPPPPIPKEPENAVVRKREKKLAAMAVGRQATVMQGALTTEPATTRKSVLGV